MFHLVIVKHNWCSINFVWYSLGLAAIGFAFAAIRFEITFVMETLGMGFAAVVVVAFSC